MKKTIKNKIISNILFPFFKAIKKGIIKRFAKYPITDKAFLAANGN
jgi:hypothetical protein